MKIKFDVKKERYKQTVNIIISLESTKKTLLDNIYKYKIIADIYFEIMMLKIDMRIRKLLLQEDSSNIFFVIVNFANTTIYRKKVVLKQHKDFKKTKAKIKKEIKKSLFKDLKEKE